MSYSNILRAVKKDNGLQQLGENVTRIRKTAKGEILLQLTRAQTGRAREYKDDIAKLLGDQAEIKALTHELPLKIRDLDEITTKDDIVDAIRSQIKELNNFCESSIKNLRPAYAGTLTAAISLPALEAGYLLGAEKIKIGWVVCRIREKLNLTRCFRCLEYGHTATKCTNAEDRSECCIKCGGKGHFPKPVKGNLFVLCAIKPEGLTRCTKWVVKNAQFMRQHAKQKENESDSNKFKSLQGSARSSNANDVRTGCRRGGNM